MLRVAYKVLRWRAPRRDLLQVQRDGTRRDEAEVEGVWGVGEVVAR